MTPEPPDNSLEIWFERYRQYVENRPFPPQPHALAAILRPFWMVPAAAITFLKPRLDDADPTVAAPALCLICELRARARTLDRPTPGVPKMSEAQARQMIEGFPIQKVRDAIDGRDWQALRPRDVVFLEAYRQEL